MIINNQPVRATIFFGLFCALIFIPFGFIFEKTVFWSIFLRAAIFTCLALYSLLLASWAKKKPISVIFPLVFLFVFIFSSSSVYAFLLLCLGMLSWIRSGICSRGTFARSLGAEIIFSIGGGVMVAYFNPYSTITWALGIWMFFLVQSLYFIIITAPATKEQLHKDAFEQALMRAENILKGS